jgi:hypothetical protein
LNKIHLIKRPGIKDIELKLLPQNTFISNTNVHQTIHTTFNFRKKHIFLAVAAIHQQHKLHQSGKGIKDIPTLEEHYATNRH